LETYLRWLSEDVVSFEIEVGVTRKLSKSNSDFTRKITPRSNLVVRLILP